MRSTLRTAILATVAMAALLGAPLRAGQSPETTIVVAAANVPDSLRVALAWCRMRGVPLTNLAILDDVPTAPVVPIDAFRDRILAPLDAWLDAEGMAERADLIVWSIGFPYGIDFASDVAAAGFELRPPLSPIASLTGLTFLADAVRARDPRRYLDLRANGLFRAPAPTGGVPDSVGFRRAPAGAATPADRYRLSAMLGYVGPHGSTVDAVLAYLARAAAADGTRPSGTFCFMANDDVRAATRAPMFDRTVAALRALGLGAEVLTKGTGDQDGVLPRGRTDVLGVCAGIASFDWSTCGSTFAPGALAEHLTSFGAHFGTAGQTKCVKFLEAGAAGTCGTVAEPYAVPHKFPAPWMHVHYARGCAFAEALYQSVAGPYQLLVLGDPLARPFARFATIDPRAPSTRRSWQGTVAMHSAIRAPDGATIAAVELWVDGRFVATSPPDQELAFDTTACDDGPHELRVVAVEDSAIATRSVATLPISTRNGDAAVRVTVPRNAPPAADHIALRGSARNCTRLEIRLGTRVLATLDRPRTAWSVELSIAGLPPGPLPLHARGIGRDGRGVRSEPFEIVVPAPR
ncbi:MAG: TIGR03790 family protein [Planctomycetes bacterium]|nr:TIGR03790 family protein [Planctomycetota bacterium]